MGKLVLGASLLALPMNPEEATKTQDNVGKASAKYGITLRTGEVTCLNLEIK